MFYLIKNYPFIILFVSLLLIAYGVFQVLHKRSLALMKESVSSYHLFKGKRWLSLLIVLVCILNCFMFPLKARQTANAEISLNYAKASQGLNPNGTRYNPAGILSAEILENAMQKGAFRGVTASDLGGALNVAPKVQGNSREKGSYFISTQFVLSYHATKNTARLNGETVLKLTAEAYKEWFVNAYSSNIRALDMEFEEIRGEDYLDICSHLKKKGSLISSYMTSMAEEEPAYQSASLGETFQSIASQAQKVSESMVEKLEAYLMENSVSKEKVPYMSRLSFQNVFSYFKAQKAERSNRNNLTAISMYEDDMARIVLVPTYDANNQFYMSQTRIGIDDFAKRAESYAEEKAATNNDIARNNHVIQQLSALPSSTEVDEKAETLIQQIENELNKLADKARTMVEEYSADQANEYIMITVASLESQVFRIVLDILLFTLLFAVAVHCMAFAAAMGKNSKKTRRAIGEFGKINSQA